MITFFRQMKFNQITRLAHRQHPTLTINVFIYRWWYKGVFTVNRQKAGISVMDIGYEDFLKSFK